MGKQRRTNRKGYFVQQLRIEGIMQQSKQSQLRKKGERKQPKIAARQARQRKKIYMKHMQQRINQLTSQIESLKKQNLQLTSQCEMLHQILQQNKQKLQSSQPQGGGAGGGGGGGFAKNEHSIPDFDPMKSSRFQGLLREIKKMSINLSNNDNEEVARSLSVLRDKYGISGRERLKTIDQEFDKMINIVMPMHFRLLMEHCMDNKQFYSLMASQFRTHSLVKLDQKTRQILTQTRPHIIKQRQQYDRLLISLAQIRTRLKAQNYKCQSIVDQIEDGINPTFVARLLLDLDYYRRKDNFENIYPSNFWGRCKDDGFEMVTMGMNKREGGEKDKEKRDELWNFQEDMEIINGLFS